MILDQKQKQFWNRHAKRNNNPRDANVSVLLGAFVSRSTVQNPGSLLSPRPLAAAALPRKLFLVFLVSECVLHPPWLGLLVRIGVGWWWKSSAWWRGRGKAPP